MPKYYVYSGDIRTIVTEDCTTNAVIAAIKKYRKAGEEFALGSIIVVSERGFNSEGDDSLLFDSETMLDMASEQS
jgi:hypothetical protein